MGSQAAGHPVCADWRLLKGLDVSYIRVCIGHLLNSNWSALEELALAVERHFGCIWPFLGRDELHSVKQASALAWPGLKRLCLVADGAVDGMGMTELTKAEWPCLQYVHFNKLPAGQPAELFTACRWPMFLC